MIEPVVACRIGLVGLDVDGVLVREFAEQLLRARGQWDDAVSLYLAERGEVARRASRVG